MFYRPPGDFQSVGDAHHVAYSTVPIQGMAGGYSKPILDHDVAPC
jgi:hypothetical protein